MKPILEINLKRIKNNYLYLKNTFPSLNIFAVVKANAYGLGLVAVSKALVEVGCEGFFCATLEEALFLRNKLPLPNIYVLNGIFHKEEKIFFEKKITPIINSMPQFYLWNDFAKKKNVKLQAVLQFDIGLSRFGLSEEESKVLRESHDLMGLDIKFLMAHLSCSFLVDSPINVEQAQIFQRIRRRFPNIKTSLSASYGLFLGASYHHDIARCGIAWTGCLWPSVLETHPPLQSAIKLKTKILQIKHIKKGAIVGYGATFKASTDRTIAIIAMGFGNGFPSLLSNKYKCFLGKYDAPFIGYISMDLITIDLTGIPKKLYEENGEVEIIGGVKDLYKMSELSGMSMYELLTSLGNNINVDKIYTEV